MIKVLYRVAIKSKYVGDEARPDEVTYNEYFLSPGDVETSIRVWNADCEDFEYTQIGHITAVFTDEDDICPGQFINSLDYDSGGGKHWGDILAEKESCV